MTFPVPRQIDAKGEDRRALIDVQAQLVQLIETLNRGVPILSGRLLDVFQLQAGVTKDVMHGLGRPFRGWVITRLGYPGATAIVQEADGNPDPSLFLRLNCAQAVSLALWVF